ncbi:MAG: hypothetical protein ACI4MI_03185 [Christensenellales bacterium]
MATIYFDVKDDFLLIDGKEPVGNTITALPNATLAISYMSSCPDSLAQFVKLTVKDNVVLPHPRLIVINCQGGIFCIRFKPLSLQQSGDKIVLSEEFITCNDTEHCLTCYRQGGYHLSVETENELTHIDCPAALDDLRCRAVSISQGQLLSVTARCNDKKFLSVIRYDDDYEILLQCFADEIDVNEDYVCLSDRLFDMCGRTVHRYLSLSDGNYVVDSIDFEYDRTLSCCDELLCYALAESCFVQDWDMASRIAPAIPQSSLVNVLGNFVEILDVPVVKYRPNRIGLVYGNADDRYVRYYDFYTRDGVIERIIPT